MQSAKEMIFFNYHKKVVHVYEVPLTLAEHDSDIKIKACTQKSQVLCL